MRNIAQWTDVLSADALGPGEVVAITDANTDWVVWRSVTGAVGVLPRACPHLDADLAGASVKGTELECHVHGWCFDVHGRMGKRNVHGRYDTKGIVDAPRVRECNGRIEILQPTGEATP